MTLPACAAVRRAAAPLLLSTGTCYRLVFPACTAFSSKPAARRCCRGVIGQTDRQTDGRTLDRFIDPAPHAMPAVSITLSCDDSVQAVDSTRLKASEIDFRVAQLEKEFTLNGAQRSGFWEEFEVGVALNVEVTVSSLLYLQIYAAQHLTNLRRSIVVPRIAV